MRLFSYIFLFLLTTWQLIAQTYPVQVVPVLTPPYSSKIADYANPMANKVQLQLITTDLSVQNRPVQLYVEIKGNGLTAASAPVLSGVSPLRISGGEILRLTNAELASYFQLRNLQGITSQQYASALPDGMYSFCFRVKDVLSGRWLSQSHCAIAYLMLNDPPILNIPSDNEQVAVTDFQNIIFSWTPRQINATNVTYSFELREILDPTLDPRFAFEVSRRILKEDDLRMTTFVYDVSKPNLIPGRRYAWRVRAISTGGLAENSVFKNNGYSEVHTFVYAVNCSKPLFLLSEQQGRSRTKLLWQGHTLHQKYHIQYRKKNVEGAQWFETFTRNTQTLIADLEAGEYEFRVGATCETERYGINPSYVYSDIQTFKIEKTPNTTEQGYNCGIVPKIAITNQKPLNSLVTNEVFTAGDFAVTLLEVSGSNGVFSGKGFIKVPYLNDTKLAVEFENVKINSDYQLTDGIVKTTYDADWKNVQFIENLIGQGKKSNEINVPFEIDKVETHNGEIVVTGKDGRKEVFPFGGNDSTVKGKVTTTTNGVTSTQEYIYRIDKDGKVSEPQIVAQGGKPTKENTNGVSKNGEATALTAKGIEVTFENTADSKYAYEVPTKAYSKDYQKLDGKYIPFKAVVKGETEPFLAKVHITDKNISADSLIFKTDKGALIESKRVEGSNDFLLTLKGFHSFAVEQVQATIKQGKKYQIAGVFNLVHLSPKTAKVILVPTSENTSMDIDRVKSIYSKIGVTLDITWAAPFDITPYLTNGVLETKDVFGDLTDYSPSQQALINAYKATGKVTNDTYYVFITNAKSSTGQGGYMALGGQFGFVFDQTERTLAHELGHGIFKLAHPFKKKQQGNVPSLMDYTSDEALLFADWKQINDPAFKIGIFQGQSEGEQISDILLLSRFIENIKAHSFKIDYDYSKKELSDETINFLPEVTLRFSKLEDSGFYSSGKIKTTDGDELNLSLWVGKHFNKYFNFDISNEGGLGKIISPDQKSIRYYRYFNNPTSQDKEVLTSRVLETNAQYFNGIIIQVPNKYVTIFENSVLNFANDKERKERWLNALNKNIETENYEELQKYPTLPFSLVGVKARLSLLEKLSKQKLTTSNSFINKIFSSDLDKEILYVTLLNSIINDQNTEQNNELFNRFVSSYFQKIYDQVDDETTRLKLYKAVGRLAASSNQENVKSKFIDIVNSNSFDKHHGALLASILMGLDEKNIIETQTNLLTLLNDNSHNIGGLKRLYNKLESEDQEYFNYYFSKWAKKYYYDQYQELEVILNSINKNGNINQGIDCNSNSIQYFAVNHIALDYINVFDKCGSYPLNCHYLQTIIPNVDTKNQYFFSYGENRKRKECSDNNNKSVIYYKAGKPFSDFVILFFNESYEYANIKKGDVRIVPLFWAENFAAKHHKKLSGQQLTIALETAGILLAATTGGQSFTAVKAITITLGASAIGVEIYENDLLKLEGGKDFVESVRLINALVGGAILVKAVGSSIAVVDLQKIKNFFINVPEKAVELKKGLNSFLATAKSGIHFTKEALTEIKALLYEVDLQSSFKQIVQGATVKVKNDLKAYIVAANMEYEIASLRYLDALDGQKLLLTPSVVIVDNTLGYKKIGTLENVYITVNNDTKKAANIGVYTKGEKVVLSLEKNLKSEINEIDTYFNTPISTDIKLLLNQWDDDLLKTLQKDLSSNSTGGELRQLLKTEDDFLKWKLIKEDPAYAFEISKTDITWTKWGKSNFFKTITKTGKEFELAILNKIKTRIGKEYEALKKLVPDLDDRKLVEQMHFCLPGLTPPCNKQGEFFIADQVWIKYDEFDEIVDMVVVETKLSQNTGLTTGQTLAQQQAGKGSLFYKPTNAKKTDINDILLPKEIKQGTGIKLKDFYRLYGDGNKTFKGITK